MKIFDNDCNAIFIERPNRFIIFAELNNEVVKCHCPNTGRMGELLQPGVKLILEKSKNSSRKTPYSVVAVYKGDLIVPITSARANSVASEIIIPKFFKNPLIRAEYGYKNSRFDFFVKDDGNEIFIEVKSCTLFKDKDAIFPDAPTTRGVKHLNELEDAVNNGYKGVVILVVFNHLSNRFYPNHITDPLFASTLKRVSNKIDIIPYKVGVDKDGNIVEVDGDAILPVEYLGDKSD